MTSVMPVSLPTIEGHGLVLRGWDDDLVDQLAQWGERGFPYHAFDLGHLRDPFSRAAATARFREANSHRHYIACEDGVAVGRVSVNMRDDAGLYLWSVHVPPEHGGRGVCRRMLAALMGHLEFEQPGRDFILSSNTFATNAHRAYEAVGFRIAETRWHYDREIAEQLWKVPHQVRAPIATHIRFQNGRWEVRTYVMRRKARTPMRV